MRKKKMPPVEREKDEEVFISVEFVHKQLRAVVSPSGGCYTIKRLAQRLSETGRLRDLSPAAKQNLIRRALELRNPKHSVKKYRAYIGVRAQSGTLTARRPSGIPTIDNDEIVVFEPRED
jgi:hypothetical protein